MKWIPRKTIYLMGCGCDILEANSLAMSSAWKD
jgi:hypothetical protein